MIAHWNHFILNYLVHGRALYVHVDGMCGQILIDLICTSLNKSRSACR